MTDNWITEVEAYLKEEVNKHDAVTDTGDVHERPRPRYAVDYGYLRKRPPVVGMWYRACEHCKFFQTEEQGGESWFPAAVHRCTRDSQPVQVYWSAVRR